MVTHLVAFLSIYLLICNSQKRISCSSTTTTTPRPNINKIKSCPNSPDMDIIILNDISCPITQTQCNVQQQMISEAILLIKGNSTTDTIPRSRVAYFEFDTDNIIKIVSLNDSQYNANPVTQSDINSFSAEVQNSVDCIKAKFRDGEPDLDHALDMAFHEFDSLPCSEQNRERHILIFSNCQAPSYLHPYMCENTEDFRNAYDVNILMVNNGEHFVHNDSYMMCLVENNQHKIFTNVDVSYRKWEDDIRGNIQYLICNSTTPEITTGSPVTWSTEQPVITTDSNEEQMPVISEMFRKRDGSNENISPCIRMKINLETENLLPINHNPDPSTNIAVIGKAIGDETNGKVTVPMTPYLEDGDDINDFPGWEPWELDPGCEGEPQVTQRYWPNAEWNPQIELSTIETNDGFMATADMTTDKSAVYIFRLSWLPLDMFHECNEHLNISAAIYLNNELVKGARTYELIAPQDFQTHNFTFPDIVSLLPNTTYEIRFQLSGGYPSGCNFDQIHFPTTNRRRLAGVNIYGQAYASSCQASKTLARSPTMKASVTAMCEDSLGFTARSNIETGLFRQHSSMSATKNLIFKTGSLYLYNITDGRQVGFTDEFPGSGIKEPCIAVDEDKGILYAIGGYKDGTNEAVNTINAFNLTDDINEQVQKIGEIIPTSADWKLEKNRYGASCMFWKDGYDESLIVIGGMSDKSWEFTDKMKWYTDVKIYPIPEDLSFTPAAGGQGVMNIPLTDYTPLLSLADATLWLFGGKTHKSSVGMVNSIDLDCISDGGINCNGVAVTGLADKKALPLVDVVKVDVDKDNVDETCKMVFSGQSYADFKLVEGTDGLNTNKVTLFCNANIEDPDVFTDGRRRLSEFDRDMLEQESFYENRRGLQDIHTQEETEVLITEYDYHLDGIWYNYDVEIELCYEDNDQLMDAVEYYNGVINSGSHGLFSEKILNVSLETYSGWSDGYGDVNVIDLDILGVQEAPCSDDDKNKHGQKDNTKGKKRSKSKGKVGQYS